MDRHDRLLDKLWDRVHKAVLADGQKNVRVDYSAYDSDDNDNPIDNLDEVAVTGNVVLVGFADEFYGGKKSRDYCSPVLTNPTWLQVTLHANRMISKTRDTHHCFLEGLRKLGTITVDGQECIKYEFVMGS